MSILTAIAEFTGVTGSTLLSLSIHKLFLEDIVTNWGKVLTKEALGVILREIDEALIEFTLSADHAMTAEESRQKIQEIAEALTGASWDTRSQQKAVQEVIQGFDFTIYTEKLTRRIMQDYAEAYEFETIEYIEGYEANDGN